VTTADGTPFSTEEYVAQVHACQRLDVSREQWIDAVTDKATPGQVVDELRMLWEVEADGDGHL
jgi:hypothetical protein